MCSPIIQEDSKEVLSCFDFQRGKEKMRPQSRSGDPQELLEVIR